MIESEYLIDILQSINNEERISNGVWKDTLSIWSFLQIFYKSIVKIKKKINFSLFFMSYWEFILIWDKKIILNLSYYQLQEMMKIPDFKEDINEILKKINIKLLAKEL